MNNNKWQICVLGGGFGGLYTALSLSRVSWLTQQCEITLVEKKERFLFTPLLYETLTQELQGWEIAPSYNKLLNNTKIKYCQEKIQGIELKKRIVNLANGENLKYDYLVLSLGTQTRFPNIPGAQDVVLTFRSLADAELLDERLRLLELSERQCLRVAVIGGGPNGVELACKISDRLRNRGEIHLMERGEQILKQFSPGVRKAAHKAIKARRINIHNNTNIKSIDHEKITIIREEAISSMPVDLVLWTAGSKTIDWLHQLDCQQNNQGKLLIHPTLQLLDYPEVFALGDAAKIYQGKQSIPATAQVAYQQASCAAKNIQAIIQRKKLSHFHYLHLGDMLTLGKGSAIVSSFGLNIEGKLADIMRRIVYIQRLPTLRHRLQVFNNVVKKSIIKRFRYCQWQLHRIFSPKSAKNYQRDS